MGQFDDDPSILNAHTEMQNSGAGDGRDMSVVIAENLDKMQKQYLSTGFGGQSQYSEQVPREQNNNERFRKYT